MLGFHAETGVSRKGPGSHGTGSHAKDGKVYAKSAKGL